MKISSKRPLRSSSGGSFSTPLAVATTNTGDCFSAIQVSTLARTRWVVPPSLRPSPPKPLSISSIQSTQGAMASARWIISRVRASLAPTRPAKSRPTSSRNRGIDQLQAMALAVRDLPVP